MTAALIAWVAFAGALPVQAQAAPYAAEQARLESAREKKTITALEADRLARLIVAGESRSVADYRLRWQRIEAARDDFRADDRMLAAGGPYRSEWLESRWLKARAAAQDPLAKRLFERVFHDQWALSFEPELERIEVSALQALIAPELNAAMQGNAAWLKDVLGQIGWFDISKYGAEASQAAWLIVQHSDHDPTWQRQVLAALAPRVESGDMQPRYYAYLVDRVAVNANEKQTYGTQGRCVGPGNWQPLPLAEPEGLAARRESVGLEPIETYRARFECS